MLGLTGPRLGDFAGTWRVDRTIDDRLSGRAARFAGRAVFAPSDGGLAYREAGRLRLGDGPELAATREYLWREADGMIDVRFADGRRFHAFDPAGPVPEAEHACGPDRYRVRYDFTGWPGWRAEWRVTGPRKDYLMVSRYDRAGVVA